MDWLARRSSGFRVVLVATQAVLLVACSPFRDQDLYEVPDREPLVGDHEDFDPRSGEEALEWLMAGNHRFWRGQPRSLHTSPRRAARLKSGQNPFAIILGCADSRVSPELVFDHGLGDLFVIRVAGNVVEVTEAASIEYAAHHLHCPLLVVLGHERCGAVTAALAVHDEEPGELVALLDHIKDGLGPTAEEIAPNERVHRAVEKNVRVNVARLREILAKSRLEESSWPLIVGAVFELETGKVRLLDG